MKAKIRIDGVEYTVPVERTEEGHLVLKTPVAGVIELPITFVVETPIEPLDRLGG